MCRIMTGLVISNLIIIVVILSSVEDSGFFKKPEKTHEVNGLKEERLAQATEKLGNFARIILRSTRRREKNSARNEFQSRQGGKYLVFVSSRSDLAFSVCIKVYLSIFEC